MDRQQSGGEGDEPELITAPSAGNRLRLSCRAVKIPTAPIVAAGLVGGYLVARKTGIRPLGGAVLAGAGAVAGRQWTRTSGPVGSAVLSAIYLGSFGVSHPLAKKVGAWPAVIGAASVSAAAAWLISDRNA